MRGAAPWSLLPGTPASCRFTVLPAGLGGGRVKGKGRARGQPFGQLSLEHLEDGQEIHPCSAGKSAKRPKQTAGEVFFLGDKRATLLFQSLCLQAKAEAQAGFLGALTSRGAACGPRVVGSGKLAGWRMGLLPPPCPPRAARPVHPGPAHL